MLSAIMADAILLLHLAFILFVVFGGLLVFYRRWLAWIHIPMVLWASVVNWVSWICPLTPLENLYRRAAGQAGYEGSFLEHYLLPIIYPEGLGFELGIVVAILVFVWNGAIYAFIFRSRHH